MNEITKGMMEIEKLKIVATEFNVVMKRKLYEKYEAGYQGWDDKDINQDIWFDMARKLFQLSFKDYEQAVDVANYAMMLWWQSLNKKEQQKILRQGK